MKQISRLRDSQNSNIIQWLGLQLNASLEAVGDQQSQASIHALMQYRQNKIYHFYSNDLNSYFTTIWEHIVSDNPDFQLQILEKMGQRQSNIVMDLNEDRLKIIEREPLLPFDFDEEIKNNKLNILKLQSQSLKKKINQINSNLEENQKEEKDIKDVYNKLYSEQKIKQAEEFVRKNRQLQLQRKKKLQQQRKKEEQALNKKQAEIKQQEQQELKAKKSQILRKQKEQHERREKQKLLREQRNTEYMRIKKEKVQKPPLYQKIIDMYSKRYSQQERQRLNQVSNDRKKYTEHVNSQVIEKHQKQYDEIRQKKDKQRRERHQAMINEHKSRPKLHSSYELKKPVDLKQIEKQLAKEKIEKIKQYRSVVKEKFKPKIDENKRRELMNLIEEMDLSHKHVKRVRLQNGTVMYEQLKSIDPKMIGISYLQHSKQIAARAKQKKKDQKDSPVTSDIKQYKRPINYLQEIRKNRVKQEKTSFVEKTNMTFDEKVKKVMLESQKLAEVTKQNEMMLKFGKFKTSEQILACKEQIDQNYLDIVNMKLKLILSQQQQQKKKSNSRQPESGSQYQSNS